MRIKEITWRHRNDFNADMQCEHCEHNQKLRGGYADDYYCRHIIPNMKCESCGLATLPPPDDAAAHSEAGA